MHTGKLRKTVTGIMLAAAMSAGFTGAATAAGKTIKIAFLGSQADEDYDGSLVFKDYVESRTNGEITVDVYFGGQFCGSFQECIDQIMSGVLEVTISTIGGFGNIFPPGQVLDLPYMFRDDRVAECVFDGPFVGELRAAVLDQVGPLRLMTVSNTGGWRNFATVNKQIRVPADIEGQKIRTIPADIQIEMVKLLGGAPTPGVLARGLHLARDRRRRRYEERHHRHREHEVPGTPALHDARRTCLHGRPVVDEQRLLRRPDPR